MQYLAPKVLEALEFASVAHDGQRRKYPSKYPYISHPAAVALILAKAGFSDDVVIAGALHDVLEDTGVTGEQIREQFGERVLHLVMGVTEDKTLPWAERKHRYNEYLAVADGEVNAISAADLIANRQSMLLPLRRGENPYGGFSQDPKDYAKKIRIIHAERIAAIKARLSHPMVRELEQTEAEAVELTEKLKL